jgi:hypothetical protein
MYLQCMKAERNRAFWICAAITSLNALVSAGFSVAHLLAPSCTDVALYAASRSLALLVVVLGLVWFRSRSGLVSLAVTMALVQSLDTLIGAQAHDPARTFGPLVFAVATFASAATLLRSIRQSLRP